MKKNYHHMFIFELLHAEKKVLHIHFVVDNVKILLSLQNNINA